MGDKRGEQRILLWTLLFSAAVHVGVSLLLPHGQRDYLYAYHQLLSESFLQGSLSLVNEPPSRHDLSLYNGRLFLYWGPVPATLLVPIAAAFGVGWPPYLLSLFLGVLGTALAYQLLRVTAAIHRLDKCRCAILVLTYSLGSPAFPLAMQGSVWPVSQLFATSFLFLAASAAFWRPAGVPAALTSAASFSLACLSRISVVGAAPCLLGWLCGRLGAPSANASKCWGRMAVALCVFSLSAAAWGTYNYLRFENPFETGVTFHLPDLRFKDDVSRHGMFSLYYLPKNLFYHFVAYPFLLKDPYLGGSLFLLTPLYFGCFWAFQDRLLRPLALSLAVAMVGAALPSLLIFGTGWVQIGPRYTLDYAPFLVLLTALGIRTWPLWIVALLGATSILQYVHAVLTLS